MRAPRSADRRSTATRVRVTLLALTLLVALVAPANLVLGGGREAKAATGAPAVAGVTGDLDVANARRVTLLTGDVVVWHRTPDGDQGATVVDPVDEDAPSPVIYEQDGQLHVVPAEAMPYVQSGVLDDEIFNVTRLVRDDLHDAAATELPLLLQGSGRAAVRRAPATPDEASRVRTLDSVGMVAVEAPKDEIRSVWASLRGKQVGLTATDARLDGAGKVWLNGTVRAMLEDSVPQIGASEAWAQGYDGTGATVAVLDSGYDPEHPDLRGVVQRAQDFTGTSEGAVDDNGHGTHVTSIVAGTGAGSDRGEGTGVAPGADLLVGKVLDQWGNGSMDQIIAGMEWAAHSGADVVNISLGIPGDSDGTDPLSQALDRLTEQTGTLFVAASGNSGPADASVVAPGVADLALTVGAVTKDDALASFSSRGPRHGDLAVKPEITAPGVDIIAARAAGTSLGELLDGRYTSLSGTSMAAPHVSGAAAILAAQHPEWDADELKARLVSTSDLLGGITTDAQGSGRVDVAAAIADGVTVDTAALQLGRVPRTSAPVVRRLTYANPTDRPVRLRLSAEVTGTGSDPGASPVIDFTRRVLTVPAGGSAGTRIRLAPKQTEVGRYVGAVVARPSGGAELRTLVSVAVEAPLRTLTVNTTDRNGRPASGLVDLWSAEDGAYQRLWIHDGVTRARVPAGLYTAIAVIGPSGAGLGQAAHQTIAGDPDLRVRGRDVTLDLDARDGKVVTVDTHRRAEVESYEVLWQRTVGGRSLKVHAANGLAPGELSVVPGRPAAEGTLDFVTQWQLQQPMFTARVAGRQDFALDPPLILGSIGEPYVGRASLPVVYAGAGTPADYEDVDAQGKAVLVTRQEPETFSEQVQAAKAAGAAVLLVHNTADDMWRPGVYLPGQPAYTIGREAGTRLRAALRTDPGLRLEVRGLRDATYVYDLAFPSQRFPADTSYQVGPDDIATIRADYRDHERTVRREMFIPSLDGLGTGISMGFERHGPLVRTEYVTAGDDVRWHKMGTPHEFISFYWVWSPYREYEPRHTYRERWWGPLVHPGVVPSYAPERAGSPVARFRDVIRATFPHHVYGDTAYGDISNPFGDVSELTLSRNGREVGRAEWPQAQFTVPKGDAEYALRLEVDHSDRNWSDTSTATDTTWTFRSRRHGEGRTVLPLVQLGYDIDADAYNRVDASSSYPLRIETGYQPGFDGPDGFDVTVEVSYDDGATWVDARVRDAGAAWRAIVPPAPEGAEFATVRVMAEDEDGNALDQRIDRAWKVVAD